MHTLNGYVHIKAHPNGSMAKAYIAGECLTFCSRHLHRAETKFNHLDRNEDGGGSQHQGLSVFMTLGKPLGQANIKVLSYGDRDRAILYVLRNCEEVQPFMKLGKPLGQANIKVLSCEDWGHAHLYVLRNCEEVQPFME